MSKKPVIIYACVSFGNGSIQAISSTPFPMRLKAKSSRGCLKKDPMVESELKLETV